MAIVIKVSQKENQSFHSNWDSMTIMFANPVKKYIFLKLYEHCSWIFVFLFFTIEQIRSLFIHPKMFYKIT